MSKTVLITGSTSGIGLGIAKKLSSKGFNICINGFGGEQEISKVISEVNSFGGSSHYFGADLSSGVNIKTMILDIIKKFGAIDILVNNAGVQHVSKIEDFPDEKYESIINVNLNAAFYSIKYSMPQMKKNNFGRIVNVASAHSIVGSPFKSAYVAAKHGVLGLTKSIALEVAEYDIAINSICPGYVKTDLVLKQVKDTAIARNMREEDVISDVMLKSQATRRFVDVEEVADMVLFLVEQKINSITGSHFVIDGGWTAS